MLCTSAAIVAVATGSPTPARAQMDMSCIVRSDIMPLEGRLSPLDSVMFRVDGPVVKICYGRPSARGRTMLGNPGDAGVDFQMGVVPYGKLWRTGANEATLLRTPIDLVIAGIHVSAGTYSLYTVPGPTEWEIIVNRSYSQWGQEGLYTDDVRAQEVGRGRVHSERADEHVETFTIGTEDAQDGGVQLILEWEQTRVRIPVRAGEHPGG